jgi:hypothetical protein
VDLSPCASIAVTAALAGLVSALGIAAKLTFFPLIIISVFCCRRLSNLVTYSIAFLASLAIVLIPIYSKLARLSTWILNLGIHSGNYGQGSVRLPGVTEFMDSVQSLLQEEPLVLVIPLAAAIGVAILFFGRVNRREADSVRFPLKRSLLLLGLQALSFVAIAKHPATHYLIPLCLSTGLSLVLFFMAIVVFTNTVKMRLSQTRSGLSIH